MASDVLMPRLSDSMEEGTVLKWLVEVGGDVKRGAPLVEIETDKANMTHEADVDGVLLETLAGEGDTLPIGEPIARIGAEGEQPAAVSSSASSGDERSADTAANAGGDGGETSTASATRSTEAVAPTRPAAGNGDGPGATAAPPSGAAPASAEGANGRIKASPIARRMAGELDVELDVVQGTGPGGRIVKADVESAAKSGTAQADQAASTSAAGESEVATEDETPAATPKVVPPPAAESVDGPKGTPEVRELTRLQQTVVRRMSESKATAPDFALEVDVDMTAAVELRARIKEENGSAPSFNDMVVKACALALREHPKANGAYRDGRWELYPRINVGIAVAADGALVVPVVPDADEKSLGEISRRARNLATRVRDNEITPPELSGGTFTVSNLGMYGIDRFTAIINAPQAAILAVGALAKRPAVDERGRIVARDQMTVTLVCDHRILDGAQGAEFLDTVRAKLEKPLSLAL